MKTDPVGPRYYDFVKKAELAQEVLFWLCVVLSFIGMQAFYQLPGRWPEVSEISYLLAAIAYFSLGLAIRIVWQPKAEDGRRADFLSNAFNTSLTTHRSVGYYNNTQAEPLGRVTAQTMENALFTTRILAVMIKGESWWVGIYLVLWLAALAYKGADLAIPVWVAQVVFSEQIVSRWVRMVWLRHRSGRAYDDLYKLVHAKTSADAIAPWVLSIFSEYETAKAVAAIQLSGKVFKRLNEEVTKEWDAIRKELGI